MLLRDELVRERPQDDARASQTLPAFTALRVVRLFGKYAAIARERVILGYVPNASLQELY